MKPRWLGLLVLLVAVVVSFTYLGLWQLDVARAKGSESTMDVSRSMEPAKLTTVMQPHETFPDGASLKPVTAQGHYDGAQQVLVAGRLLHGQKGYWVLTPFVVERTGARLAVVRGFVSSPDQADKPLTGDRTLTVTGALAPGEKPSTGSYQKGQLGTVDLAILVNRWGGDLYNAFIFMTDETKNATAPPVRQFPPPRPAQQGLKLLNAGYALQWWIFALFAIYLYWHMVVDDYRVSRGLPPRGARRHRSHPTGDNEGTRPSSKDAHV